MLFFCQESLEELDKKIPRTFFPGTYISRNWSKSLVWPCNAYAKFCIYYFLTHYSPGNRIRIGNPSKERFFSHRKEFSRSLGKGCAQTDLQAVTKLVYYGITGMSINLIKI